MQQRNCTSHFAESRQRGRWLYAGFEIFRKRPSEQLLVEHISKIVDDSLSLTEEKDV